MSRHTDNVRSEMDVLMLGCVFPKYTSVTAKKSLKWVPFLGWFSTLHRSDTPLSLTVSSGPI